MSRPTTTLRDVCANHLLDTKWLAAPSYRVGHQWIEKVVRSGQPIVNLHPTTLLRLALDLIGSELAEDGLMLASRSVGSLVIDASWHQLSSTGYLGRLNRTADLSLAVFDSLLALRLAGCGAAQIEKGSLESAAKVADVKLLLHAYESFLKDHKLVDEADVLRRASAQLNADPQAIGSETLVLIPGGLHVAGVEREFIDALPGAVRVEIRHPADGTDLDDSAADIRLLANIGKSSDKTQPQNDGSVQFFRAVGEVNEVREVLRRCLSGAQPMDSVEILHTDVETYVPLIYATARRYSSEGDRSEGVPVTFAEGIPTSLSRPGRALAGWLQWIEQDYPQRMLVEMIGDGLLECGDNEQLSFTSLAHRLRPVAIGFGADNYLPKLDEQIKAMGDAPAGMSHDGDDTAQAAAAHERKRKALQSLRKLIKQLLTLARDVVSADGSAALAAAERFLKTLARSVSENDRYAAQALIEQLQDRQLWLERLGVSLDMVKWLTALPAQIRILGSGPRPGHLHVAGIGSGGHSGRTRTFVIGLDDRRFPGASLQDPILLDHERGRLSPELPTSASRLRQKVEEFATTISRLPGTVTLSWPCHDLADDRETFPSSVVLSGYRLVSGRHDADLETLNGAVGPPVSFAPETAEKALDESERWLWRLTDDAIRGTNQIPLVEARFPHLARGSAAERERSAGFGPFNGHVPRAGEDLNPFSPAGPVLSASALETAGRCPLAFFFRSGLSLYPPDELEVDQDRWLDAAQFGLLLHDVFRHFMHELSSAGRRPEFERDHARLAEILQDAVKQWRKDVPPPNENAFRVQCWQLIRASTIFLDAEEEFCRTSQPRFFEVALGLQSAGGGSPLDDEEPITVDLPNGNSIRAKGRIDRVDETKKSRYAVWDYKLGSGYGYDGADPFLRGRRVQGMLYLRMIETALRKKLDPVAVVEHFGYFFPGVRAHGLRVHWDAEKLATGLSILERLCQCLGSGVFLATDHKDDCRYCHYTPVCRNVDRVTTYSKGLLAREDLAVLRDFREVRRG